MDFTMWPSGRDALVGELWMLALANLVRLPEYDGTVGERATLSGRNLEAWRGMLAVALWLESEGVIGLFGRMESLSVSYQSERRELEKGDMTSLVLQAIADCIAPCSGGEIDVQQIKSAGRVHRLRTKEITDSAKRLVEVEELDFDVEQLTTRSVGRILGKLRFRTAKVGAHSKNRGWDITTDELERLLRSFSVINPDAPELMRQMSETSSCPPSGNADGGHEDIKDIMDVTVDSQLGADSAYSEDAEIEFYERAAIMEFDGGLSRNDAERRAALEILRSADPAVKVA